MHTARSPTSGENFGDFFIRAPSSRERAFAKVRAVQVVFNYLVMAMGLALDTRGVGTRDELLNRPLVWAYFVLAAWTAGGAYHLLSALGCRRGVPAGCC